MRIIYSHPLVRVMRDDYHVFADTYDGEVWTPFDMRAVPRRLVAGLGTEFGAFCLALHDVGVSVAVDVPADSVREARRVERWEQEQGW